MHPVLSIKKAFSKIHRAFSSKIPRYGMWLLHRELRKHHRKVGRIVREAERKKGSHLTDEEFFGAIGDITWERDVIEAEIAELRTQQLRNETTRLLLDLPPYNDDDKWGRNAIGNYVLTNAGIRAVREEIRREKAANLELTKQRVAIWVPLLSLLIGLFGTLLGWCSILRNK